MTRKHILLSFASLVIPMMLPSCTDDNDNYDKFRPTAVVTVCPNADGSFVMQLDDETQLIPTNLKTSPFGDKEVRALVNFTESQPSAKAYQTRNVEVNWLDSIRTKLPVESLGELDNEKFGNDPIEIVNDWVTVAEDGYLTLRIRTVWNNVETPHVLNLVSGINPDDPFELELRHDAKGDTDGNWGDALIAFNLNQLPRTGSETETINLKWKSFNGDKSTSFKIKMRPINTEN